MQIRNGDLELHLQDDGDPSAPPILMIHGITSSWRTWSWLVPALADRYRLLRLDLRGHGSSDRAPGEYVMEGYVGDAIAAAEAAGRPVIVIGHSLGGATAIGLAQARPDLVRALVLEDPPLFTEGALAGFDDNALVPAFQMMRASIPTMQAAGMPAATLAALLGQGPSPSGVQMSELLHADALEVNALGLLELDASVLDPVIEGTGRASLDTSRTIDAPTLLVAADPASPDAIALPDGIEAFRSFCPGVEVTVMAGASHLIHDEQVNRATFQALVLDFLGRLD